MSKRSRRERRQRQSQRVECNWNAFFGDLYVEIGMSLTVQYRVRQRNQFAREKYLSKTNSSLSFVSARRNSIHHFRRDEEHGE